MYFTFDVSAAIRWHRDDIRGEAPSHAIEIAGILTSFELEPNAVDRRAVMDFVALRSGCASRGHRGDHQSDHTTHGFSSLRRPRA